MRCFSLHLLLTGFNPRARTGRDGAGAGADLTLERFNPRARTGRDQTTSENRPLKRVSIHAPARGATVDLPLPRNASSSFNPRARTGRDRNPTKLTQ